MHGEGYAYFVDDQSVSQTVRCKSRFIELEHFVMCSFSKCIVSIATLIMVQLFEKGDPCMKNVISAISRGSNSSFSYYMNTS
jgi:hypothetical protein